MVEALLYDSNGCVEDDDEISEQLLVSCEAIRRFIIVFSSTTHDAIPLN